MNTSASPALAYQIQEKLAQLEAALLSNTPDMPVLLRDIHRTLKSDPEICTILSPQECATIVRGLKKITGTTIATTAISKSPKKSLSKLTTDDL
jgi:hypothetical protein